MPVNICSVYNNNSTVGNLHSITCERNQYERCLTDKPNRNIKQYTYQILVSVVR